MKASFAAGGMAGGLLLMRPVLDMPGAPILKQASFLVGIIVMGVCVYGGILRLVSPEEAGNLQMILLRKKAKRMRNPGLRGEESHSRGQEEDLRRSGRK